MPLAEFEPAIPAGERLQTHALDRSATGIGFYRYLIAIKVLCFSSEQVYGLFKGAPVQVNQNCECICLCGYYVI